MVWLGIQHFFLLSPTQSGNFSPAKFFLGGEGPTLTLGRFFAWISLIEDETSVSGPRESALWLNLKALGL